MATTEDEATDDPRPLTIAERKKQLEDEMRKIYKEEQRENLRKLKKNNYEKFKNRGTDWIVGKAHVQFEFQDNGWHMPKGEFIDGALLPNCVSIHGNCGKTYYAVARVTTATSTYFHNCIPDRFRDWFAKKLLDATEELMRKVLGNARCTVELLGLQSTIALDRAFAEEDVPKVKAELQQAQDDILNKFPVEELEALGTPCHGGSILQNHLKRRKTRKGEETCPR